MAISSSIRRSVVLVIRLSISTRPRMAARAASGSRKVAANPSRASYQSWLPGIAYNGLAVPMNGSQKFAS